MLQTDVLDVNKFVDTASGFVFRFKQRQFVWFGSAVQVAPFSFPGAFSPWDVSPRFVDHRRSKSRVLFVRKCWNFPMVDLFSFSCFCSRFLLHSVDYTGAVSAFSLRAHFHNAWRGLSICIFAVFSFVFACFYARIF